MIYKIAKLLRDQISALPYVEIAAGLAKPVAIKVNTSTEEPTMLIRRIPQALNDLYDPCEPGDLLPLVPDTSKLSIHWWEDQGLDVTGEDTYYYHCKASLRLVSWWNLPLLNILYTDANLLVANLIANIPARLDNTDYLTQIRVVFGGEQTGAEVVSQYDFDEPEYQFTTYPYQITGLDYTVDFAFTKNCVDAIALNPTSCP